jgi:hypothetical protein
MHGMIVHSEKRMTSTQENVDAILIQTRMGFATIVNPYPKKEKKQIYKIVTL